MPRPDNTNRYKSLQADNSLEAIVHMVAWAYVFISPLFLELNPFHFQWENYLEHLPLPFFGCITFYLNYLVFTPKLLIHNKRLKTLICYNFLIISTLSLFYDVTFHYETNCPVHLFYLLGGKVDEPLYTGHLIYITKLISSLCFFASFGIFVRLARQWHNERQLQKERKLLRSEAELRNLRNQFSPHFLLNTLNNIYALTAFDTEKAQKAIEELSQLLRYILYENNAPFISLNKETEFIRSYIQLMQLRLNENIDVSFDCDIPEDKNIPIAPLIFIPLVENAFKHGISPQKNSFIHIYLKADTEHIHFCCKNSNYPKNASDKSPGGIGLQQVALRLKYAYRNQHSWNYGTHEKEPGTYRSEIIIWLSQNH